MVSGMVSGASDQSRLNAVQAIGDQLLDKENWLENLHAAFMGQAIRIMQDAFQEFFIGRKGVALRANDDETTRCR